MALRGTGYAKRSAGTSATQVGSQQRATADAEISMRTVPLDFSALVAPYRGQGRISLRVERLPHRTRLSRGQNNGDHSWSLSLDDLNGLCYLAPKNLQGAQTLSVRIVSLDGGDGATIAVVEYPVQVDGIPPSLGESKNSMSTKATPADSVGIDALREELEQLKLARRAQEDTVAQMRQSLDREWEVRARNIADAELEQARVEWEVELEKELNEFASRSASEIDRERERWRKEIDTLLVKAEKNWEQAEAARFAHAELQWQERTAKAVADEVAHVRSEADSLRIKLERDLKLRETALLASAKAEFQQELEKVTAEALIRSKNDVSDALNLAELTWKAEQDAQLAAAERKWQEQTASLLAQARTEMSTADQTVDVSEFHRLREEIAAAKGIAQARETELNNVRRAADDAKRRLKREAETALAEAKEEWRKKEAERFSAAEVDWQNQSARLVAEARAEMLSAKKLEVQDQINLLRDEVFAANITIANRDKELEQLRQSQSRLSDELTKKFALDLSNAQEVWTKQEAARLADARAQWSEEPEKALARALSAATENAPPSDEPLLIELRNRLSFVQSELSERDTELSRLRRAAEELDRQSMQKIEEALAEAKSIWAAGEQNRLAAAEVVWNEKVHSSRDNVAILRLRDEVENLKSTVAVRDVELAQVRAAAEQMCKRLDHGHTDVRPSKMRNTRSAERRNENGDDASKRHILRDIAAVAAAVVFGILLYPYVIEMVPYEWWPDSSYSEEVSPPKPVHSVVPAVELPTDIVSRAVNVRSGPSKIASVIMTLDRGVDVRVIERHGNWAHVKLVSGNTAQRDGWLFGSFLRPAPAAQGAATPADAH